MPRCSPSGCNRHGSRAWLVNTGWSGGPYGVGRRLSIRHTRAIIDAIHSGELAACPTTEDPIFGLSVPTQCSQVPEEVLVPRNAWPNKGDYDRAAQRLAGLFRDNFRQYVTSDEIRQAGPRALEQAVV